MAAFNGYKVKDRSAKVEARRTRMPDDNRKSIAVIQAVIVKKGRAAAQKAAAR